MREKFKKLFNCPKRVIHSFIEKIMNIFIKTPDNPPLMLNSFITSLKDMSYINCHETNVDILKQKIFHEASNYYLMYEDNIQNIIGVLTYQDLVNHVFNNKKHKQFLISSKFLFLPYMVDINEVLKKMMAENIKIVIAVDARGNTLGFFEKMNIINYFETNILLEEQFKQNIVKISGSTLVEHIPWKIDEFEICYKLGIRTIGGFLSYHTGYVPSVGEIIKIDDLEFQILEATDRKINLILIKRIIKNS